MKKTNNGKIAVRPHQKTLRTSKLDTLFGYGQMYLDCEASRSTEDEALARPPTIPRLDELLSEIATLERIGRDPKCLLDHPVRDRPLRPIYGSALWAWIGRQPGITMTSKEVERWLKKISGIEQTRADMGLDSD